MNISNVCALVTGGASGLGAAVVRAIGTSGGSVAILDLDEAGGMELLREIGDTVIFCKTDVTSEADVATAVDAAIAAFGRINVLVNAAGITASAKTVGKKGPMDLALFERVMKINCTGTFNAIRLAAAKMTENTPNEDGERGVIINTASIAAFDGQIGQAAYAASKAAIVGMTLPIARDLSSNGIRNVTIAPGIFDTPMMAAFPEEVKASLGKSVPFPQRMGKPDEYAGLVLHVIANTMINGETIRLDGALRMAPR